MCGDELTGTVIRLVAGTLASALNSQVISLHLDGISCGRERFLLRAAEPYPISLFTGSCFRSTVGRPTRVSGGYWRVTSTSVRDPVTSTVFSIGSAPAYTMTAYVPDTTCGISKWPLESARATYGDDAAMI